MPRFDKTGPMGQGPYTGHGMGVCGANRAWRRGRGFGRLGFGPAYMGFIAPEKKEELEILEEEAGLLGEDLKEVTERIAELKKKK